MCGISGVINSESLKLQDRIILNEMCDSMKHRGPDNQATWEGEGVILGHNRLAIIDLSEGGRQPQSDISGRYTITFNGEIFNFKYLKQQINDYPFNTDSDTEVILAAFEKWGVDCPKYLKGQFAFAIWDNVKEELFLSRDRMGEKPLYYSFSNGGFYFASEIRAVLKAHKKIPVISMQNLVEFFKFQSVCAPNTLIEDIFQLQAGYSAIYSSRGFKSWSYWDINEVNKDDFSSEAKIHKEIYNRLSESVNLQMMSDVPLGAFLSGGIDSSTIVALMAQNSDKPVETFTIGFSEVKFDESAYAAVIAKKFNTNHHNIILSANDLKDRIPEILHKMDNPSGDGPNTFIVSEAVKKAGLTVALSGLGGDELFAGYSGFKNFHFIQNFSAIWEQSKFLRMMISITQTGKRKELLRLKSVDISDFYSLSRSVFSASDLRNFFENEIFIATPLDLEISKELPILSQYSVAEITKYTQNVLLKDTDQMAMANSLEVRVPFFDHDLVEYVLGIPDIYKYPKYPKSLLVDSLNQLLPNEIINRTKMGFSFPWDSWIRNDLYSFCEDAILSLEKRKILKSNSVYTIWNKYLNHDPNIKWSKIWLLVTLEKWFQNIKL